MNTSRNGPPTARQMEKHDHERPRWWHARVTLVAFAWLSTTALAGATLLSLAASLNWAFELASHFAIQYAWAAGVLTALFAILRRPGGVVVAAALLVLHGWQVVAVYRHVERARPVERTQARLLITNVLTSNQRHDDLLSLIRKEQPDVVLLMEVDEAWARALEPLAEDYPHALRQTREDNFGVAFYSRLPDVSASILELGDDGLPSLEAEFDVDGRPLRVLLTHPRPPVGRWASSSRDGQLRDAAEHARGLGDRTVLVGDFNATPWSPIFREVLAISGMSDSRRGFGVHATFPSRLPAMFRLPIDHVLATSDLEVVDRRIGPHIGSDHRAVIVDVR